MGPLEVNRSKLSRHLQGVVFRCHKCTFTCSSDHALQLHLHKHDLKPYRCQLCYYDSRRRGQLEEHLRLEHKVRSARIHARALALRSSAHTLDVEEKLMETVCAYDLYYF